MAGKTLEFTTDKRKPPKAFINCKLGSSNPRTPITQLPLDVKNQHMIYTHSDRNEVYTDAAQVVEQIRHSIWRSFDLIATLPRHDQERVIHTLKASATRQLLELAICLTEERVKIRYPLKSCDRE